MCRPTEMPKPWGGVMAEPSGPGTLTWEYDIPLVNNLFMLRDFLVVIVLSLVGMQVALLIVGFFAAGGPVIIPFEIYLIVGGILVALFLIAAGVVLGNRHRTRFTVSPAGVAYEPGLRERQINRVALVLSVLGGRPGASLLAVSRESGEFHWDEVGKVTVHQRQRVITLGDSWHPLLRLYCPTEGFAEVVALVDAYTARAAAERVGGRPRRSRPLRASAAWVGAVAIATLLGMTWYDTMLTDIWRLLILAALLVMGAGLFNVPVVRRLLAVAGLLMGACVLVALVVEAAQPITGPSGATYGTSWEVDTPQLALSIIGQLVLIGMGGWRLLGRSRLSQPGTGR